jgi:alpha-tubulin suppressor-like RCC1 family protein
MWGPVFSEKGRQSYILEPALCQISSKQITKISIGEKISCLVDTSGRLFAWGLENDKGQLGC